MADSKLLVVLILLFVLLCCDRCDAVIGDVIDTEALDLKPNQEIEKLKSKIETLGIKYEIGDAIDSEALDLKPEQEIEKLKSKIETLGIKYEIGDAIDSEAFDLKPKQEIEKLKSKIESLESTALERINELKRKNDQIRHLEDAIKEKSAYIGSLISEIALLQEKGVMEDEEAVRKVHAHNEELQNRIAKLQSELEIKRKRREAFEVRGSEAEKEVNKLIRKLEKVEKTNGEQRAKIHDIEHSLQVAEKDLMGAQREARTKAKELTEFYRVWLPHWLVMHVVYFQDLASTRWDRHGRPAIDFCLQKVAEKAAQSRKWMEPHLNAAKTVWIPTIRDHCMTIANFAEHYVRMTSGKTVEAYGACRSTINQHIINLKEKIDPFVQEAKKLSEPHINKISTITGPHVAQVHLAFEPYKKHVVLSFQKFLETASSYRHQVHNAVQENLKKHELTKPLATKMLGWCMGIALSASTLLCLYKIFSVIYRKRIRRTGKMSSPNHPSRRHKRRHVDKKNVYVEGM
ncbi:CAP-Gly domain-containing linker protein 1-like [Ananas comosus]|uniref:CAP-Gly domain-containing linker protein 1-like n=2 Tax=Ananas comosus TaxID=4615 RepID=A0A6P5GMT1_ANACO|nr:CAP-Gly domain-containing linker protein 1-like [Ananas comosus]